MTFKSPLLLFFIFIMIHSQAQTPGALLNNYNHKYPQEKIHLHFDKDMYVAGETIWFKAYLLSDLLPDTISSTLVVEMIDANGKVAKRQNLPVIEGTANGSFQLPEDLQGGYYTIHAYTGWMLNFDAAFLFNKNIFIYNGRSNATTPPLKNNNFTVDFFPEGGNLVMDVVNYIAFKGTDAKGYPVSFTGSITDSKGNNITDIKTMHDGMGKFTLLPQLEEKYSANLKFENGKIATVQLPAVQRGVALHIDNDQKTLRITLTRSADDTKEKQTYSLLGQMENHVLFETPLVLEGEAGSIALSEANYPTGILQVTVFDAAGLPVRERLTFVNNDDYNLKASLIRETLNVNSKAKNVLNLSVPDNIEGSFSISITDDNKSVKEQHVDNIVSRFLLSSDIRGYVHEPAYYFMNNDKPTRTALELVMMTNGWRRFKWDELLSKQQTAGKFKPLPFLHLSGKVYTENKKDLITQGALNFIVKVKADSSTAFFTAPIDPSGNFNVDSLIFRDTAAIFFNYNTKQKNKKQVWLKLDQTSSFPVDVNPSPVSTILSSIADNIFDSVKQRLNKNQEQLNTYNKEQLQMIQLKEIKINVKKRSPTQLVNERYTSSVFSTPNANTTLDLINNKPPNISNLIVFIRNQIPGIDIVGPPGNQRIVSTFGATSLQTGKQEVAIYLDQNGTDFNELQFIPIDEVALVKFVSRFVYASSNGPALLIYRKNSSDLATLPSNYVSSFTYPGYSISKEFYSPNYDIPANTHTADIRTTLLWNPDIYFERGIQKVPITFFNSDNCKRMRVIVQGFNKAGKLCVIEKILGN